MTSDVLNSVQSTTLGGQTNYVSYKFTGNLVLEPGQMIQIQSRFNLSDWANMLQDNDWSFAANTSYTPATKVTAYEGGTLVWGQEPSAASAALKVASVVAYPNPSTGNGVNLAVNLSGNGAGATASAKASLVSGSIYGNGNRSIRPDHPEGLHDGGPIDLVHDGDRRIIRIDRQPYDLLG